VTDRPDPAQFRVTIGVTTYFRPAGLGRLLESLSELDIPEDLHLAVDVLVVDNDENASAKPVVEDSRKWLPFRLRYEVEKRRGIAHARNAVVRNAGDSDLLVFVDDDEFVSPTWLALMVRAQRTFNAEVIVAPVIPVFPPATPAWIIEGQKQLYHYPRYKTGDRLTYGHTGNVLFTRSVIDELQTLFDERFGLTGSEDTMLFMQLVERGTRMYWCDEAEVFETVPPERATFRWIVKRAYSGSNSFTTAELLTNPGPRTAVFRIVKGLVRIGIGVVGAAPALLFGRAKSARMIVGASKGVGMIAGVAGRRYEAYRVVGSG
jgi:succinoglycan biosynthesis protein ExoM